jgi:hypothetical protein
VRALKRLQVRIGNDEFDALNAGIDHAIDCVAAAAADADDFNASAGDRRLVINENIYTLAWFAYRWCHWFFLSSKPGRLPRLLSSILRWLNHRHLYIADNILCHRRASIQHLVKKYYY